MVEAEIHLPPYIPPIGLVPFTEDSFLHLLPFAKIIWLCIQDPIYFSIPLTYLAFYQ